MMNKILGVVVALMGTVSVAAQDLRETIGEAYDLTHALDVAEDGSLMIDGSLAEHFGLPTTLEATDAALNRFRDVLATIVLDLRADEYPEWLDTAKRSRNLYTWISSERKLAALFERGSESELLAAEIDLAFHTTSPDRPEIGGMLGTGVLPWAMNSTEAVLMGDEQVVGLDLESIRKSARRLATRRVSWPVGEDPGGYIAEARDRIERVYERLGLDTGQLLVRSSALAPAWHGTWTGAVSISPFGDELRADLGDDLPRNQLTLTFSPNSEDPNRASLTIERQLVIGDGPWAGLFDHAEKPLDDSETETIELRATDSALGYWIGEIDPTAEIEKVRAEDGEAAAQEAAEMFSKMVLLAGQPEDNRFEILWMMSPFGSQSLRLDCMTTDRWHTNRLPC